MRCVRHSTIAMTIIDNSVATKILVTVTATTSMAIDMATMVVMAIITTVMTTTDIIIVNC